MKPNRVQTTPRILQMIMDANPRIGKKISNCLHQDVYVHGGNVWVMLPGVAICYDYHEYMAYCREHEQEANKETP